MKSSSGNGAPRVIEYEDGRTFDAGVYRQITQQWVDKHMALREQQFTKPANCSIFCATWNVNAKKQEEGLESWLTPPTQPMADIYAVGFQEMVDLNAMNVALNSSSTQQKTQFWTDAIKTCLCTSASKQQRNSGSNNNSEYHLIAQKSLVGLLLCVFAREQVLPHIKDVRCTSLGVGLMGMMGNKGGVSVRMSVYDSTICFVCAHLAAHRENVLGRNSDFKNIYEKSIFTTTTSAAAASSAVDSQQQSGAAADVDELTAAAIGGGSGSNRNSRNRDSDNNSDNNTDTIVMPQRAATQFIDAELRISDHEIVYWFGDLNYRIDDSLSTEQVFHLIESEQFEELHDKDQLHLELKRGAAFQGFSEGLLNFPPTYKYQPGTDRYETRAEKKLRAPAWCDRVLWKCTAVRTMGVGAVRLLDGSYQCAPLHPSDHKPVSAAFLCELRTVVEEQQRVVFDELMQVLVQHGGSSNSSNSNSNSSSGAMEAVPVVTVDKTLIRFEKVKYMQSHVSEIEVRNAGDVVAVWHFVNKMDEMRPAKHWISIDTQSGLLLPNESVKVAITVMVDCATAHVLNAGKDVLDDLLQLRVEKGSSFHISVSASYSRSCFGMSLAELVTTLEPVSNTLLPADRPDPPAHNNSNNNNSNNSNNSSSNSSSAATVDSPATPTSPTTTAAAAAAVGTKLSIPKELWRLIDALWASKAVLEKDLFNSAAEASEVAMIRQALDCGGEFTAPCSAHALAQALMEFLCALPQPVLPPELYPASEMEPAQYKSFCRRLLDELPQLNFSVFVYLISFFREVLAQEKSNRCTALLLSTVCASCLMLSEGEGSTEVTISSNSSSNSSSNFAISREERSKRLQRKLFMQPIFMYFLVTQNI